MRAEAVSSSIAVSGLEFIARRSSQTALAEGSAIAHLSSKLGHLLNADSGW
jgi:hypothetical protein